MSWQLRLQWRPQIGERFVYQVINRLCIDLHDLDDFGYLEVLIESEIDDLLLSFR